MGLKKNLGLIDVFCIATGAMISSGIFILPGLAFSHVGPAVFVSYFLAGILALAGVLSVIELATAMPRAGGDYYFITRSMGPMTGTVSGFLSWFALSLKSAFAIFGLSEVLCLLLGIDSIMGMSALFVFATGFTVFFTLLNIFGVKEAAKLEVLLVVGLILLMAFYILFGITHVQISRFDPFVFKGKGFNSVLSTAGFVFISFGGLLKVASIAEEVNKPGRNLPIGMISSVVAVTVLYALMLLVTVGILHADNLTGSMTPVADAARIFMGTPGYVAITIAAVLAFVTTANAGIMSASRYPLALSRDKLAPGFLGFVSRRFETPAVSVAFTGLFIILALTLELKILVKAASTVILTTYILANLSIIILRESKAMNYRPTFRAPFYPWVQIVSIVLFGFLIVDMGFGAIEISLSMIAAGLIIYMFYGRKTHGEYAFLLLLERITNRKLTSHNLESELKEVIRERDGLIKDDFDDQVESAGVLDLKGPMESDELFGKIADNFADDMNMSSEKMLELMKAREEESSTAISPFVAIPHIIAEGEKCFKIIIVRCSEGAKFSEEADSVKAVFVIIGSRDMRNLHLKALAAIAQIVQNKLFEGRWAQVNDEKQLRDILLLGKRKRNQ